MNRRAIIRGLVASTASAALLPSIPVTESIEARQREALRLLLSMPSKDGFDVQQMHIALSPGGRLHDYAFELLNSGLPVNEIRARLHERVGQLVRARLDERVGQLDGSA